MGRPQPFALSLRLNWGNKMRSLGGDRRKQQLESKDKGTLLGQLFTITAATSASYLILLSY